MLPVTTSRRLAVLLLPLMAGCVAEEAVVAQHEPALLETGMLQSLPEDPAYLGVWELEWDAEALRALEPGDRVTAFFRPPVGEVYGLEVLAAPGAADGALRGRFLREGRDGPGLSLTLSGERMVGQFTLEGVRYRIVAGAQESRLYAIDQSRLPPPAQPDTPPEGRSLQDQDGAGMTDARRQP